MYYSQHTNFPCPEDASLVQVTTIKQPLYQPLEANNALGGNDLQLHQLFATLAALFRRDIEAKVR
jgi:hypothetical protein